MTDDFTPLKAFVPTEEIFEDLNVSDESFLQLRNACLPMVLSAVEAKDTLVMAVQPLNALAPTEVSFFDFTVAPDSLEHPAKALAPIPVSDVDAIDTLLSAVQPENT